MRRDDIVTRMIDMLVMYDINDIWCTYWLTSKNRCIHVIIRIWLHHSHTGHHLCRRLCLLWRCGSLSNRSVHLLKHCNVSIHTLTSVDNPKVEKLFVIFDISCVNPKVWLSVDVL